MATAPQTGKNATSMPARMLMSWLALIIGAISLASLITWLGLLAGSVSFNVAGFNSSWLETVSIGGLFLAISLYIMFLIARAMTSPPLLLPSPLKLSGASMNPDGLEVKKILEQEFEYGRETAAQAMEHRLTIVNFYLLVVGGAGSVVGALLATNASLKNASSDPFFVATVALLWTVFLIGWLTLFKIIRLRVAWIESAMAMNYIKEFYLTNAKDATRRELDSAFFFKTASIPKAYRPWNVFHLSALLVALLGAGAFFGGFMLLGVFMHADGSIVFAGGTLALIAFLAHAWAYDIVLKPKSASQRVATSEATAGPSTIKMRPTASSGPAPQPNTVVSSKQIYSGHILTLRVDDIRLPDGQTGQREIVAHQPATVIVAYLDADDAFLFVEQYRDAVQTFLLEVPAGLVNSGELPEQTARRELLEETGYEVGEIVALGEYFTSPGFTDERHHLYLARKLTQVAGIADPDEISAVRVIPRSEVMGMIDRGEIRDGKSILGILRSLPFLPASV